MQRPRNPTVVPGTHLSYDDCQCFFECSTNFQSGPSDRLPKLTAMSGITDIGFSVVVRSLLVQYDQYWLENLPMEHHRCFFMDDLVGARHKRMSDRRQMQFSDWLIWLALMIVGGLLGVLVVAWVGFEEPAFLHTIVYFFIPIGFVHVFIFFLFDVADSVALNQMKSTSKKLKPLFLLVSLPAGFIIGVIAATFSLSGLFP